MRRDMQREAAALGLPLHWPEPFPPQSLLAARVALLGCEATWAGAFSKGIYHALFGEGRAIGERHVIDDLLQNLGLAADHILAAATSEANKARLKAQTEAAAGLGIFGAPSFVTPDGELFWGNDRLEAALAWCAKPAG
jgi:2-hydroxychromene-2-carboxylate isomerase